VTRFRKISLAFFSTIVLVILCAQCFGQVYRITSYCQNKKCHSVTGQIETSNESITIRINGDTTVQFQVRTHLKDKVFEIDVQGYTFFVMVNKISEQVVMEKKYRDSTEFIVYNYRRCKD
jgi:hypothetical protein